MDVFFLITYISNLAHFGTLRPGYYENIIISAYSTLKLETPIDAKFLKWILKCVYCIHGSFSYFIPV